MTHSGLVGAAMVLSMFLSPVVHAQMMQAGMMGGSRHGMINLVSPADSPIQIRRGSVMFAAYATGMMGARDGSVGIRIVLRLSGVTDGNGLLTSTGNHLIFEGQLTMPTDNSTPIRIDQPFALHAGSALVQVPLSMSLSGRATITIDGIAVEDSGGNLFAVPGINLTQSTRQVTRQPTPRASCTSDSDCNDGDPDTQDICMPVGCRHMPGHMSPGGRMM